MIKTKLRKSILALSALLFSTSEAMQRYVAFSESSLQNEQLQNAQLVEVENPIIFRIKILSRIFDKINGRSDVISYINGQEIKDYLKDDVPVVAKDRCGNLVLTTPAQQDVIMRFFPDIDITFLVM